MIPNTNDGTQNPPRLRVDINGSNVFGLPAYSSAPKGSDHEILLAVKAAGFEGIQTGTKVAAAREAGLRVTGGGRINTPAEADQRAREAKDAGVDCYTVHVGWGTEDDAEAARLVEAVLSASEKHRVPIYIETHRATIMQDNWRSVQLVRKFPEIRFNGDFSHYYTGHEMVYGDFAAKLEFIAPILERVRFIHGRIGTPGCIQTDIGDGVNRPYVEHFKQIWTRCFQGFLKSAKPGDYISFTPELLGAQIFYARTHPNAAGEIVEESDRWEQAKLYARIAKECWDKAKDGLTH